MSVTNAISSVIIVGAIIAALTSSSEKIFDTSNIFGYLAIVLVALIIIGCFLKMISLSNTIFPRIANNKKNI